jgi:outer membrane cobalamin receptor
MSKKTPVARPLAVALTLALAHWGAQAQSAAAPAAPADGLNLDRVIVTGTAVAKSKMDPSVSVSTIASESIVKSGAQSAAGVLRRRRQCQHHRARRAHLGRRLALCLHP